MTNSTLVEIPLSKTKLAKLLIFSILFLVAGCWMIVKQPEISNALFNSPVVKALAGYGGALMGLFGIYFFSKKLLDKRPGLIISEAGIIDNTSAFSLGLIPWSDIVFIQEYSIQASVTSKQKFITIGLNDPENYISKESSAIKRKLMSMNTKHYGSPLHLSTNGLKIKHEELLHLLEERFKQHKSSPTPVAIHENVLVED